MVMSTPRWISNFLISGPGDLSTSAVKSTVARALGGVKACYLRRLQKNVKLSGRVNVLYTISINGRVAAAETKTDTVGAGVGQCIVARRRSLRFPPPEGGSVHLSQSFYFQPVN